MTMLYHVSNWSRLSCLQAGETFTLTPGAQGAEGSGVYFAEGAARLEAADGCQHATPTAIVCIEAESDAGWWQSKAAKARKFGKARTWHSDGKCLACRVLSVERGALPVLHCAWRWE